MVFQCRCLGVLGFLGACSANPSPSGHPVQLGEEVLCTAPSDRIDFQEQAAARGIVRRTDTELQAGFPLGAGLVAVDADQDGDIDLLFSVASGFPQVFENDGVGNFSEVEQSEALSSLEDHFLLGFGMVDFDGDALLDVVLFGPRTVAVALQEGALRFGALKTVFVDSSPQVGLAVSAAFGDADNDGDLDLFLPGLDPVGFGPPDEVGVKPSLDRLLVREGKAFHLGPFFQNQKGPGLSMVALFGDREGDGDQDLFVPSLRGYFGMSPSSFYRNTGAQEFASLFTEDAASVHADLPISGMGIDSAELNSDGQLDYCMSDLNRMHCLLSSDAGTYAESAVALGLVLPAQKEGHGWSGWSVDLADLDNNGSLDLVVAGGAPLNEVGDGLDYASSQDFLWWGQEGGFALAADQPFQNTVGHYGMAVADLDNNGALDVVFSGVAGEVRAFYNGCKASAWTDVRLAGPPGNPQALGARVFLRANGQRQVRQIQGLRALAQGPARAYFGLGEAESIGKLTVAWPDGAITISRDLPVNRPIVVPHPSRLFGSGETGWLADSEDGP